MRNFKEEVKYHRRIIDRSIILIVKKTTNSFLLFIIIILLCSIYYYNTTLDTVDNSRSSNNEVQIQFSTISSSAFQYNLQLQRGKECVKRFCSNGMYWEHSFKAAMSYSKNNPHRLDNVYNFRAVSSPVLKQTVLYRSANLMSATERDKRIICSDVGCRTYIDLRSDRIPSSAWEQAWGGKLKRYHCSVAENLTPMVNTTIPEVREFFDSSFPEGEKLFDDDAQHELFLKHYMIFSCKYNGKGPILKTLQIMSKEENYPIVFGCHAGKDRTGLIALFVNEICGLSRKEIFDDYLLSNPGLGDGSNDSPGGKVYHGSLKGLIEWLEREFGSIHQYLEHIGLGMEEMEAIRGIVSSNGSRRRPLFSSKL